MPKGWMLVLTRLVRHHTNGPRVKQYLVWTPDLTATEEGINLLKMAERTARMTLGARGGREAAKSPKSASPPGNPAPANPPRSHQ